MQIEQIETQRLVPYARNSRTHSAEQVAQIVASIREFGFTNPVLIDDKNMIVAGHGRVLAASSMGMEKVPCIRLTGLTEAQIKAYVIADNQLALGAGWDAEILKLELADLSSLGFNLDLLGFNEDKMLGFGLEEKEEYLTNPDDVPELNEKEKVSKPGDIWLLGRHRIMCGDSTNKDHVAMLLNGSVPALMVTDPPYGVEYDASWREKHISRGLGGTAKGKVLNDDRADWSDAWALFPGDVAYVWHASTFTDVVATSLSREKFALRSQIIWAKSQMVIIRGHYHPQHEPCWYAVRKGKTSKWAGGRKQKTIVKFINDQLRHDEQCFVRWDDLTKSLLALSGDESTVWEIQKPLKSETGHSTQKPVECMARPMRNHDIQEIYEPFSGSGTTIIAAEQLGRSCYAMELSEAYVDLAVVRWQNFTGKTATLESTGEPFPCT